MVGEFYDDPLNFAISCFPWGEPGPLENFHGPEEQQRQQLREIGQQVRERAFDGVTPVAPIRPRLPAGTGLAKAL